MTQDQEQEQSTQTQNSNINYLANSGFMTMRLDTSNLIIKIENFLSSQTLTFDQDKNGQWFQKLNKVGDPLASPEGIMRICNIIEMRINLHVAQGNFTTEHYWDFISRARKEITETIVKKCYEWKILDTNLNMIIDEINALLEAYLTRPIDNLERDSYGQQFQSKENTIVKQEPRGGLQSFAGTMRG